MIEKLKSAVMRLQSGGAGTQSGFRGPGSQERVTGNSTAEETSQLFQCRRCTRVYVATDKGTCSQCDQEVERVPSTLTECEEY